MKERRAAAVLAFSQSGAEIALKIAVCLEEDGYKSTEYIVSRHKKTPETATFQEFESVREVAANIFDKTDAIIFVCAVGIAVRSIAPLLKSKLTDPAVIVCDEGGTFAVSLLSGHVGGANSLAEKIGSAIGAKPVITTASDVYANHKAVAGNLVLGIGCRRNVSPEIIERAVTIMLWDRKIPLSRVAVAASIDVKRNEDGLLEFARVHGIPMHFYSSNELSELSAEEWGFTQSERVLRLVGVDNVCERAAVYCGQKIGKGTLIMRKTAMKGVTVAVFELSASGVECSE